MKKALLASTALFGAVTLLAGPAAAEMEVTFGGFARAEFWSASQDVDTPRGKATSDKLDRPRGYNYGVDDAEFYIRAKNTADNGLSYGVNVDLELKDGITIDEGYVFFSGDDWGIIQLGGNDAPGIDMVYSGDFSLVGTGGYDGGNSAVWNFQNSTTGPDLSSDPDDSAKIIYYSPRFNGFQLGVSYGTDAAQATMGQDSESSADGSQEDQFSVGANYVNTINGFDIGAGVGYITSDAEPTAGVVVNEDSEGLHVGFNVGMQGFTFGASYADQFDTGCGVATAGCDGGEWWEVAAGYGTGPVSVAVGFFHFERDISTAIGDSELDIFSVTGQYTLAPGASIYAGFDLIDETGSGITDNDGSIFMVGARVAY